MAAETLFPDLPGGRPARLQTTTFTNNMALPVHRWFRYSAGFSAEWAQSVIRTTGAHRVLDPFAGSGTTVLAAESAGAESIGVDVHPFVSRVAKAKLHWRADDEVFLSRAKAVLATARAQADVLPAQSPLLAKCFTPQALDDLTRIKDSINLLARGDEYDELLWLALVSIIRICSPVGTAQWQYVLPGKSKAKVAEPFGAFAERVMIFADDMRWQAAQASDVKGQFFEESARELASVPDSWADLILTSPPYANNFDYADATRLEMSFLGEVSGWGDLKPLRDKLMKSCSQQMGSWDPAEALGSALLEPIRGELGKVYEELDSVRQVRGGKKAYHLMVVGYFYDSAKIWHALRRAAQPGVQVCYVVGDSAPYGVHVPVERWLGDLAVSAGFSDWTFEKVRDRNTKWENRKHRHPLHEGHLWIVG